MLYNLDKNHKQSELHVTSSDKITHSSLDSLCYLMQNNSNLYRVAVKAVM